MATGTLAGVFKQQFFDSNGDPLSGGSLTFYDAGTTTPRDTYSDVSLLVPNTNPLTLDSAGRPQSGAIYLTPGASYKVVAKDSGGSTQWTQDNVAAIPVSSATLDMAGTAGEAMTAGQVAYLSDGSGGLTAGRWYKADADLVYASINAVVIGFVVADLDVGESGSFRVAGRLTTGLAGLTVGATYYVSATAGDITTTAPLNARIVGQADSTASLVVQTSLAVAPTAPLDVAEGRLSLTTGTSVTSADVTAAGTIYYTPHVGNRLALYDGTRWNTRTFAEPSLALTLTSGKNYDVFAYDNAGTVTLELSAAWTNDTTRADALARQDGVLVKSGALTRRYLGTIRASGANTTEDSQAKRFVWNMYNRVTRSLVRMETTDTWTYNTATWRQANNSALNQVEIVAGRADDAIFINLQSTVTNNAANETAIAIAEDSTSAPTQPNGTVFRWTTGTSEFGAGSASFSKIPAIGYHKYCWLEWSNTSVTTTFRGDNGGTNDQSGMTGTWRA